MQELLSGKSVIFFDVGYTIDYPASGDWMFTNLFYEIAGNRLRSCDETLIKKARKELEGRNVTMTGEHATYNENNNK